MTSPTNDLPQTPAPPEPLRVSFGSLRQVLASMPNDLTTAQKSHIVLLMLRSQMSGLPRPLARRMALLTRKLGMATPQSSPKYLKNLRRDLTSLDSDIRALPHYDTLFGA